MMGSAVVRVRKWAIISTCQASAFGTVSVLHSVATCVPCANVVTMPTVGFTLASILGRGGRLVSS